MAAAAAAAGLAGAVSCKLRAASVSLEAGAGHPALRPERGREAPNPGR